MSAGFTNGINSELVTQVTNFWGKRVDTVVNINGVEKANGNRVSNSAEEEKWRTSRPNTTSLANWDALLDISTDDSKLVKEVIEFIEEQFDPRGRLILSGTSRGAANVLQVCRKMAQTCRFFKIHKSNTFLGSGKGRFFAEPPPNPDPFTVSVSIDLICILDSTFDVERFEAQRKVPGMVLQYANWFQTRESNSGKHGSLSRIEPHRTIVITDEEVTGLIPRSEHAHDFLCKKFAPPKRDKLVEAELAKGTPEIKVDNRGGRNLIQPQPRGFKRRALYT